MELYQRNSCRLKIIWEFQKLCHLYNCVASITKNEVTISKVLAIFIIIGLINSCLIDEVLKRCSLYKLKQTPNTMNQTLSDVNNFGSDFRHKSILLIYQERKYFLKYI